MGIELEGFARVVVEAHGEISKVHKAMLALLHELTEPTDVRRQEIPGVESTGQTYITLASPRIPPQGFEWDIRRVTVTVAAPGSGTGLDPFTSSAASAVIWVGGQTPTDGSSEPNFVHIATPPSTLPNSAEWSREQFTVKNNEILMVTIKSLPSGQQARADFQYVVRRTGNRAASG